MAKKEEKLKLIREIEKDCGFVPFKVNRYSTDERVDDVLEFICTITTELSENYVPKITNVLNP